MEIEHIELVLDFLKSNYGNIWRGESPFVYLQGKIKVMRYTVRLVKENYEVVNKLHTNNFVEAFELEALLKEAYGNDKVWIADAVNEILVG